MFATGAVLDSFQSSAAAPRLVRGAITYAAGSTGAIGTTTLFTVTGDVLVMGLGGKCTTNLTSGGSSSFDLGVTGSTQAFIGPVTSTDLTSGKWLDMTNGAAVSGGARFGADTPDPRSISANIIQTIASATITGGVVRWYLQYVPLSGDGLVTLHANLTAF